MATTTTRSSKPLAVFLDGSGFIHRAYHAHKAGSSRDRFEPGDGLAATGEFGKSLATAMRKLAFDFGIATYLGIFFDASRSAKRLALNPDYKGNRPPVEELLGAQMGAMRKEAEEYGRIMEMLGHEADDIIATYARMAEEAGCRVLIVSQDKDMHQMVSPNIRVWNPKARELIKNEYGDVIGAKHDLIDEDFVLARWGVKPLQVVDVLSIIGDAADNIRGIDGLGEKNAPGLIQAFGSLEAFLDNVDQSGLSASKILKVKACRDQAILAKRQILLDRFVPVPESLDYFETD